MLRRTTYEPYASIFASTIPVERSMSAQTEGFGPTKLGKAIFALGHLVHKTGTILGAYRFPIAAFHFSGSSSNVSHIAQPVDSLLPRQ